MAKCPACKQEWKWSWCEDRYYASDDKYACDSSKARVIDSNIRAEHFFCTSCGEWLGFIFLSGPLEGQVVQHPRWEGLDWEAPKHCLEK